MDSRRKKSLDEVKIRWGNISGRYTLTISICNSDYTTFSGNKLSRLQENINHLTYMDDIKLFVKDEREFETLVRIYSQDIGMEFSIEK